MPSYAVIGASRGIGLEFVRQLAARPDTTVFALVRNAAKSNHLLAAIAHLQNVHVVEADVADHPSLEQAAKSVSELSGGTLDYLIHNAAHIPPETLFKGYEDLSDMNVFDDECIDSYKVNALGVVHGISAFLPLLRAGPTKKIIVIGAAGADLKCMRAAGMADIVAYSMSKAAGHVAATKWALFLKDEGFIVVTLSPGLVDTSDTTIGDRPAPAAELDGTLQERGWIVKLQTVQEAVVAQLKVIDNLKPEDNGLFLAHDTGKEFTV